MKILIPVDGSTYSRAAAAYVARLAGTFAEPVEVHLLHVHAPLPYPIAASAVGHKVVADYQRETSQEALGVAEAELRKAGVAYRSTWCVGDVAEEVARFVATHS